MTEAPSPESDESVFRLMYRSHIRIPMDKRKAEFGAIFSVARSRNKAAGITGALLIADEWFVQTLEGDEAAVRSLYERIFKDKRHERVTLLDERTVDARTFGRWAMARVSTDGEPDIPLLMNRDKGGAVPAAGRPTTPEQDALLDVMRDATRESARPT
jgi:hypothetical protein